jgi:cellulose synthase/poly-beta-1,6-N-acetylglucosamine synthase-like glycosyltransferase
MQIHFLTILYYLFLSVAGLQLLYWLFYFVGLLRLKAPDIDASDELPGISIIVAAHDEMDNLKKLIPVLLQQDHPKFEVIIVNDRSDDGTIEYLNTIEGKYKNLVTTNIHDLPDHISGKKYAITMGVKAAKYHQVLLTDADCLPISSSWAASMSAGFNKGPDITLGFSNYQKLPGFLNYFIRFETLLTGIEYLSAAANKLPYMGVGRNLAYKKDLFMENKGFFGYQELIGGDDDLFVNKHANSRNTIAASGSHARTESIPKTNCSAYWRQKTRHLYIGKFYSLKTKMLLAIFNISWILTWILGIWCILAGVNVYWIAGSLLLREIFLMSTLFLATKKFGIAFEIAGVIFVDLIFTIYYIFVGTKALFVKTISWA